MARRTNRRAGDAAVWQTESFPVGNASPTNSQEIVPRPHVRADLIGSTVARSSNGIVTVSQTPVLATCRRLIDAGFDPTLQLQAYRGTVSALTVRSLGEGARLEIDGEGHGFRPRRKPDAGLPVGSGSLMGAEAAGGSS
jgi:hypothetical protein